ncbi:hypothetical protein MHU86_21586 [Fragilaria crotonensis]|nr:hypothetical protein MHU86_21586 [Fragilaria crotonensis]
MNATNCAALELCLCKTLLATSSHRCPACQKCVHAICRETCEDASIQYHTTCLKCFATYKATFKDHDDFRGGFVAMRVRNSSAAAKRRVAVIEHPQPEKEVLEKDDDEEVKNILESAIAAGEQQPSSQGIEQLALYKAALNDSAMAKADKIKKRCKKKKWTELDVGGYLHKANWDNLAEQFNKNTGVPEDADAQENAYLDVIQLPHHLYISKNPEDFDQLEDGQHVAQFIRWITHQYYVVHKLVSGDHARLEDKVGEEGYLL